MGSEKLIFAAVALILSAANFLSPVRDGVVTTDVESHTVTHLNRYINYAESPVQVFFTYFDHDASIRYVGEEGESFDFLTRLEPVYANIQYQPILDIRDRLSPAELSVLSKSIELDGWKSTIRCPHDAGLQCEFGIFWDREASTKEASAIFVGVRYDTNSYAILDQSLLFSGG